MLYRFSEHLYSSWYSQHSLLDTNQFFYTFTAYFELGGLTEILIVILIPLYLCLLRPFIHLYIPGMLKRIGLGMIIRLLSLLSVFIIDTIGHTQHSNIKCFIKQWYYEDEKYQLGISMWFLIFPYILNALSIMFFYIASYEFICAQSPHAMKELLIGTLFTVKRSVSVHWCNSHFDSFHFMEVQHFLPQLWFCVLSCQYPGCSHWSGGLHLGC